MSINLNNQGQIMRLVDIIIIGPLLIYFSYNNKNSNKILKSLILSIMILSAIYNLQNYLNIKYNLIEHLNSKYNFIIKYNDIIYILSSILLAYLIYNYII